MRCTHSPLWPQPGDDVTITVESLDGNVQVGDTVDDQSSPAPYPPLVDHTKIADDLEIWVGDSASPDLTESNKTTSTFVVNDVPAGDLVYGCVVKDDGADTVFTGWRRTRVGAPAEGHRDTGRCTPAAGQSRVDIVFVADTDSYPTATADATFLTAAADVIKGAYYGQDYFLSNQQRVNFWLADQTGDADRVAAPTPADPNATNCVLTLPSNFMTDYSWRDSGADPALRQLP